jgi:hypothetical protein
MLNRERLLNSVYQIAWNLLLVAINVWSVLIVTTIATLFVRAAILPDYATNEFPLNFVFETCQADLSGICTRMWSDAKNYPIFFCSKMYAKFLLRFRITHSGSFPTANATLYNTDYEPILLQETRHAIELTFTFVDEDYGDGFARHVAQSSPMFMVLLKTIDAKGQVSAKYILIFYINCFKNSFSKCLKLTLYCRSVTHSQVTNIYPHSAILPKRKPNEKWGVLSTITFLCFWPFYIFGRTSNTAETSIQLMLHRSFTDSVVNPTFKMCIEVQSRYIPVCGN